METSDSNSSFSTKAKRFLAVINPFKGYIENTSGNDIGYRFETSPMHGTDNHDVLVNGEYYSGYIDGLMSSNGEIIKTNPFSHGTVTGIDSNGYLIVEWSLMTKICNIAANGFKYLGSLNTDSSTSETDYYQKSYHINDVDIAEHKVHSWYEPMNDATPDFYNDSIKTQIFMLK